MYNRLGFSNFFCHVHEDKSQGMDLVMLQGGERFTLAAFRTEDDMDDEDVFQAKFCAGKFWIPFRVLGTTTIIIIKFYSQQTNECISMSQISLPRWEHYLFQLPFHISSFPAVRKATAFATSRWICVMGSSPTITTR